MSTLSAAGWLHHMYCIADYSNKMIRLYFSQQLIRAVT